MRVNSYFARNFRALIKAGHGPSYDQRGYDDGPREERIAQRLSYSMQQREHQQQIKRAIEDLERANEGLGTGR
jgi:hypothetical protein